MTPKRRAFFAICPALVALDLLSKELAARLLAPAVPHEVLGDYVRLTLVYNRYGAMGLTLGAWSRPAFGAVAVVAIVVLTVMLRRTPPGDRLRAAALSLLTAGAAGNLWDRLRSGQGVVDFIDVGIGRYRFWTFNVADSALTIGVIFLALLMWHEDRVRERRGPGGATG